MFGEINSKQSHKLYYTNTTMTMTISKPWPTSGSPHSRDETLSISWWNRL